MYKTFLILLFLVLQSICKAQDTAGLLIRFYDTIHVNTFHPKKVVIYKYHNVSFLLDYDSVRQETVNLTKSEVRNATARRILKNLDREIMKGDTAHLDQEYFDKLNWIPYELFLCYQIRKGRCLVRDTNNIVHTTIVYSYAERKKYWGGILFFLPGMTQWFFECTRWET